MERAKAGAGLRWMLLLGVSIATARGALSQNVPAARQTFRISVFAGASGVYTGLDSGKNLSLTAGADLEVRPFFGLTPGIEVRGMYPVDSGTVDGLRNLLGGVTLGRRFRSIRVFGDYLAGRGEIVYSPPYPDPSGQFLYVQTISNVFSPGGGAELDLSRHFGARGDAQYQRYAAPVAAGHIWATAITAALVYRFDFNRARGLPNR